MARASPTENGERANVRDGDATDRAVVVRAVARRRRASVRCHVARTPRASPMNDIRKPSIPRETTPCGDKRRPRLDLKTRHPRVIGCRSRGVKAIGRSSR